MHPLSASVMWSTDESGGKLRELILSNHMLHGTTGGVTRQTILKRQRKALVHPYHVLATHKLLNHKTGIDVSSAYAAPKHPRDHLFEFVA